MADRDEAAAVPVLMRSAEKSSHENSMADVSGESLSDDIRQLDFHLQG